MISDVLESVRGVGIYPLLSLAVFVLLFVAVVIRALRLDRTFVERMKHVPLDTDGPAADDRMESDGF